MNKVLLNAPRVTETNHNFITLKLFRKLKKSGVIPKNKEYKEFQKESYHIFKTITDMVIENRDGVMLPEFIGHIFIGSCETKFDNYNLIKKLNKTVKYQNYDTLHNTAKIFFSTYNCKYRTKDMDLWALNVATTFSKKVSSSYVANWKKYIKISKNKKIAYLYKTDLTNQKIKEDLESNLEYNELEI